MSLLLQRLSLQLHVTKPTARQYMYYHVTFTLSQIKYLAVVTSNTGASSSIHNITKLICSVPMSQLRWQRNIISGDIGNDKCHRHLQALVVSQWLLWLDHPSISHQLVSGAPLGTGVDPLTTVVWRLNLPTQLTTQSTSWESDKLTAPGTPFTLHLSVDISPPSDSLALPGQPHQCQQFPSTQCMYLTVMDLYVND